MNTRYFLVALTVLLLSQLGLKAQEEIVYDQYYYNYYLVNPAVAGAERCTHFMWTGKLQWIGMEDAPRTTTLSFRTRLRGGMERLGIGAYAYVDKNGNTKRNGGQVSLGYHIPLSGRSTRGYMMKERDISRQLSFALAGVVSHYLFDRKLFVSENSTDIVIANGDLDKGYYFNATFGTYLLMDDFFAGLTMANLVPTELKELGKNEPIRPITSYIFAGYDFQLGDGMTLEPGAMFKFNMQNQRQFDVHLKYQQNMSDRDYGYWLEMLYRHVLDKDNAQPLCLRFMGGVRVKKFNIGYTYGQPLTGIASHNKGTHEMMLGYSFCKTQHFCR